MKMNPFRKCQGFFQHIYLSSSVSDWYRTTWTLQDDPCNEYYKDLMVNPFLMVSPLKVFHCCRAIQLIVINHNVYVGLLAKKKNSFIPGKKWMYM